jgi:hypothetical protein
VGAVRGGDRRRPLGDRHRMQLAIGLCSQKRGHRLRRRWHRRQSARDAPLREHPPVMVVGPLGRRRERQGCVTGRARELALDQERGKRRAACWDGALGHSDWQVPAVASRYLIRPPLPSPLNSAVHFCDMPSARGVARSFSFVARACRSAARSGVERDVSGGGQMRESAWRAMSSESVSFPRRAPLDGTSDESDRVVCDPPV